MSTHVAVIDYGMGNLHSVANALRRVGADKVSVTSDPRVIRAADRVVFPGVGAIRDCMAEIRAQHCDELLQEALTTADKPVLAICVGMQALFERSEENGGVDCLGLLPGTVRFFGSPLLAAEGQRLKVPHMGWNEVYRTRPHPMWRGIDDGTRFYFVHSYYVAAAQRELVAAVTHYGPTIDAAIARDNLFAVQFHPEKSQQAGLALLGNFLCWDGRCDE
jgi:imidazole glycerol-phosphate synthase subunit HisH